MKLEQKIEKLEALNSESFIGLIQNLISKMGYQDIEYKDQLIIAHLKGPLNTDIHGFIYFDQQLSGNIPLDEITKVIRNVIDTKTFNTIFIVSPFNISNGFKQNLKPNFINSSLRFFGRDEIIEKIELHVKDFWKHDDIELLDYEKHYCSLILLESELKTLKIFSEKYQKLFGIFIEPKIIHYDEDKETKTPIKKNITIDNIIGTKVPLILSGGAGSGKSTLLKRIGETIIKKNQNLDKKNLPLFVSVTDLLEANFDFENVFKNKLQIHFKTTLNELFDDYDVTLLIDSIDELEIENQKIIVNQLNDIFRKNKIRFILATRSAEKSVLIEDLKDYSTYSIARFNSQQIEHFVKKFFYNQESRADKLLDALKENRIIEKLPITPLSLSLISILYEENDLEIPATITDIYDNFNSLLLGKAIVSSKIEFIDISFKERILSLYALELLKRKERTPMTYDEFMLFFKSYFSSKTIPLKKGSLEDVLKYLIESTGIIFLKNSKYVSFNHDSFMEYYAAVEIFKHQRDQEPNYINNFFDLNWQNSAIFYAGHSKDMPAFLNKVNKKLKSANHVNDFFSGINGAGYLLQALFQTDNKLRKETVDIALDINIQALELFIKMSSDEVVLFKSFKLPIIWMMNLLFFYENFNSGTLREPLKLSFESIIEKYKNNPQSTTEGYKALSLALTLYSSRINETSAFEDLVFKSPLLNDSVLTIMTDIFLQISKNDSISEIKKEVRKEFKRISEQTQHLLKTPAHKLRFSDYDTISSFKNIKIVTEGKTDAEIIEHAFMSLTLGETPYWKIKPSGNESGSHTEVAKALISAKSTISEDEIIIGLFDHDEAGINSFKGLLKDVFITTKNNVVKKHKDQNIYAILLPIPGDKEQYLKSENKYNYFEIEHYFPEDFLINNDAYKDTPIPNVYSIKDGKKSTLSKEARKITKPSFFKDFTNLFDEIDEITGKKVNYNN